MLKRHKKTKGCNCRDCSVSKGLSGHDAFLGSVEKAFNPMDAVKAIKPMKAVGSIGSAAGKFAGGVQNAAANTGAKFMVNGVTAGSNMGAKANFAGMKAAGGLAAGAGKVSNFAAKNPMKTGGAIVGGGSTIAAGGLMANRNKMQQNQKKF